MNQPTGQEDKVLSTEEKIKEAARKLFTQKGFAAVRTRDIADEAGINLALLNYYFRSKQKLFDIIMLENFRKFLHIVSGRVLDDSLTLEEKIALLVDIEIDMLTQNPDLPLFVLNEIRVNPNKIAMEMHSGDVPGVSRLLAQLISANGSGEAPQMQPLHFLANLIGLTVFPFVGRPMLQKITGVDEDAFYKMMQERKKLIPIWIKAILNCS